VLPLDHLQRGAEVVKKRHELILLQGAGLGSWVLGIRYRVLGLRLQV
jgi:hypothetical protein